MKYYDISKGELVDPDTPTLGEKFSIAGMDRDLNIKTASLPYGTQGTYGAPEETSMPNIQDLIREEGIQVGPQVKDGGLIRQNFAPKNIKRIADPPHSISDLDLSKKFSHPINLIKQKTNREIIKVHEDIRKIKESKLIFETPF